MNTVVNRHSFTSRRPFSPNTPFISKPTPHQFRQEWRPHSEKQKFNYLLDAGPNLEPVDYTEFDNFPLNRILMGLFRNSLCNATGGIDSKSPGFEGVMELIRSLNDPRLNTPQETRQKATEVLKSLFPSWFTSTMNICVSRPFPEVSARLNAWATSLTCTWLMGSMTLNDVEFEDGTRGKGQGVLVERCRFLEQSSCASICHNSCKLPTQEFFKQEMGLDVTLEPNYEDFSCQFCFGKTPLPVDQDPILQTPCFSQCPTKKRYSPMCSKKT